MDLRHTFALDNIRKIRPHVDKLTDWEQEFILDILEKELITEDVCKLTSKQFNKLHSIAQDCRKRGIY